MTRMLQRLKCCLLWMCRSPHSRGFGIQSPSAYSFVRYVVNEHYPYYAYEALDAQHADRKLTDRKVGRLLFRIANFWQPQYTFIEPSFLSSYVSAGSRKTRVMGWERPEEKNNPYVEKTLLVAGADMLDEEQRHVLMEKSSGSTLLVVLGIHATRQARQRWQSIVDDDSTGVTFDLYHCGVVFFDKSKHKRQYVVNF